MSEESTNKDNESTKDELNKRKNISSWIALLSSTITIAATVGYFFFQIGSSNVKIDRAEDYLDRSQMQLRELRDQLDRINQKSSSALNQQLTTLQLIDSLSSSLAIVNSQNPELRTLALQIVSSRQRISEISNKYNDLEESINALTKKLEQIEKVILEDPTKSLAIPLIRKDISELESNYARETILLRSEFDRIYDQNKWFIGLMFTLALGLIGLAVNNFVQLKKDKNTT